MLPELKVVEEPELFEVEIDWESKWHKLLSEKIRQAKGFSEKLSGKDLELDAARREIAMLQAKVLELSPAGEKLAAAEAGAVEAAEAWAKRVNDRDNHISRLKMELARGQRGRMEEVILWMRQRADKLPMPDPEEEIELSPERPEDFVVGS